MDDDRKSISTQRLNDFLKTRLTDESRLFQPPITDNTLAYIINLMVHFSRSEHFFSVDEHQLSVPTLAFLYQDAHQASNTQIRLLSLRRLGDCALFIGSLFPEKLYKAGLRKDYCIGMGGSAYSSLANYRYGDPDVFNEMAQVFPKLMQLVANVCRRNCNYDSEEIFSLYQRWEQNQDETIRMQLMSLGVTTFRSNQSH